MDNKLGERMKQRRLDLDLSQKELAKRAKISQGTIAQLEVGRNQGSGKILEIAIALGVSPEWLLYGKNPPERPQKVEHIIDDTDFLYSKDSAAGIKNLYLKTNNWDADYLDFIKSPDESMAPTISIFDDVLYNRLETTLHENGIFVIKRSSGLIIIRRAIVDSKQTWIYRCDNLDKTRFSDVDAVNSDIVLGRVVWRGGNNSFNF